MSFNVNWRSILGEITAATADEFSLTVSIDAAVIKEIQLNVEANLSSVTEKPNAAKIAGVVAFWIRKLKPLHVEKDSAHPFLFINEFVALKVGLAIWERYFDDSASKEVVKLNHRILRDWIFSFRYHSHSPHSSLISFELLTCEN